MADGVKMILAMALFFGVMYLYALSPEIIEKWKAKKRISENLKKEEKRKVKKLELQKHRDKENQVIDDRREKIEEHFKWLEEMNKKIERRENTL